MLSARLLGRPGATLRCFNARQRATLALPVVLVGTMIPTFQWLVTELGYPGGYLAGFAVYWVGWCLIVPALLLGGPRALLDLFRAGSTSVRRVSWKVYLALWAPLLFPLVFRFAGKWDGLTAPILGVSILLGLVIGITEEILWRGVFLGLFPGQIGLNTLYPTVGFALWHLAPQLVVPNPQPGGMLSFLAYTLFLGLAYAYAARRTGSIRWCTISHMMHDSLGLGAYVYTAWLP